MRHLLLLVLAVSFLIVGASYTIERSEFLWIGIFVGFIPLVISMTKNGDGKERLILIILLTLLIRLVPAYYSYSWPFLPGLDTAYEGDTTNLVINEGHWYPGRGNNPTTISYSFYPIKYVFTSILILVTNIDLILVSRWIMPTVTHVATLLFIYHFFRYLISKESAVWASFFYGISPGYVTFDYAFLREQFALVFFAMSFYMLAKWNTNKVRSSFLILFLSTSLLVMTHHWSSYNFVWFLMIFYLLAHVSKWSTLKPSKNMLTATFICLVSWLIYIAYYTIFAPHVKLMKSIFLQTITPAMKPVEVMRGYTGVQRFFVYFGQAIMLLFSGLGFLTLSKERGKCSFLKKFYLLSILCLITFTFILPRLIGRGEELATVERRNWTFNYIGIAVMAGQLFGNLALMNKFSINIQWSSTKIKKLSSVLCLFPIISSILLFYPPYWDFSRHDPNTINLYRLSLYLYNSHFCYTVITIQALSPLPEINGIRIVQINDFSELEGMDLKAQGVLVDKHIISLPMLHYLSTVCDIVYNNGVNVLAIGT
jgi:hypothetical protein